MDEISQSRERILYFHQDSSELFVYHGTSVTDPFYIFSSREGLDCRFSQEGLWGRGNYFSEDNYP